MRNPGRETLFERWLEERREARRKYDLSGDFNPPVNESFTDYCERITTVSDTVTGGSEATPEPKKRDELPST